MATTSLPCPSAYPIPRGKRCLLAGGGPHRPGAPPAKGRVSNPVRPGPLVCSAAVGQELVVCTQRRMGLAPRQVVFGVFLCYSLFF